MAGNRGLLHRVEAGAILALSRALQRASVPRRVAVGRVLGTVAHTLAGGRRNLARRNVRDALGVDEREVGRIALGAFRHFGRVLAECLAMPAYLGETLDHVVRVEGAENLLQAHAKGRGVIVCSGHIGNWELAGLRQIRLGVPIDYISRPLSNRWLYDQLLVWREAGGIHTHDKHGAVRSAVKVLRGQRSLAFVIDQNMISPPRVFVPFFGRPASTSTTLGHLALRLNAAVVPAYTVPAPDGSYTLRYLPELEPPIDGDLDQRIRELTTRATQLLEQWIRERPDTWLWMHKRWKSRPEPGEVA
jgi:KDO2-lipid IV(A) lauroyltransferase